MYTKPLALSFMLVACSNAHTIPVEQLESMEATDAALYSEVWETWWAYDMQAAPKHECFRGYEWHATIAPGYESGTPLLILPKEISVSTPEFAQLCDGEKVESNSCLRAQPGTSDPLFVFDRVRLGHPEAAREKRAHLMLHWIAACTQSVTAEQNAHHDLPGVWGPTEPGDDYVLRGFQN